MTNPKEQNVLQLLRTKSKHRWWLFKQSHLLFFPNGFLPALYFFYILTLLHSPINSKGWWIPLDFSHIWCHLRVNTVLFLLLPSFHHLFHFLALLHWSGSTLKKVMISRRNLVPDLKKKIIQYSTIWYFSYRGFMKIKFIKLRKFLFLFCMLFIVTK